MVSPPGSPSELGVANAAIAKTPDAPYYAVVFTSVRTGSPANDAAYAETADEMERLAREQPGFLGIESARNPDGLGITVSYWASLEAIAAWREHGEHRIAQRSGRADWYAAYALRVCRVERAKAFARDQAAP